MKRTLCLGFMLSGLAMSTAWGVADPVGVPWAEWRFLGEIDDTSEMVADKASAPGSLIRVNSGSSAITLSDGVVVFAQTGPDDYLRVDIEDMADNGGGGYVNEYTMIFDIKATQADWLPIYNTGYDNYNEADFWVNGDGAVGSGTYSDAGVVPLNTWVRLVVVRSLKGGSWVRDVYVNGLLVLNGLGSEGIDGNSSLYTNGQQDAGQFTIISDSDTTAYAGCELANFAYVSAAISAEDIAALGKFNQYGIFGASATGAQEPMPEDEAVDVLRDGSLAWTSGVFAGSHDVYFGTSPEDVNNATVPTASGLNVNSFNPGRLEFGHTYYWRVDEVNATPDKAIFKGDIWSFTVEPYSVMIPIDVNKATASSFSKQNTPAMTVNGSGLTGHTHSTNAEDMWLSGSPDLNPWLMYEFDRLEKLDHMLIWNSNSTSEGFIGWGVKGVSIEYSPDGLDWTTLAEPTQLNRAPGVPTYSEPQVVDFGLAQAKFVRLNIQGSWGGLLPQYGLAEVRFYGLPVYARQPMPASGATDVLPNSVATWRSGREAGQHQISVSQNASAVADGSAPSVTSMTNSYDLGSFDLQLSDTYYWRVDEVNDAESTSVWTGPVWHFTAADTLVVDDFEHYTNFSPDRPFQTWHDGFGYSEDEFFPVKYPGNATGAGAGHDIWTASSPHFNRQVMERAITLPESSQSLPFYYNNTGDKASQLDRTWATPRDWAAHGIQTLVLSFFGSQDNTGGPVFITINGQKVTYPDNADLSAPMWHPWHIDLASLGINLKAVTSMSIGVEGVGSGMILIDDILLYRDAPPIISGLKAYGFNDLPDGGDAIDGIHGGIDFGNGNWWGGDSYYGASKCGYFSDNFVNIDMSFTLPENAYLASIVISADGAYSYTISDGVNVAITGTTSASPQVISTGWTSGGRTITIRTSGGWYVVFDDITYITPE